MRKQITKLFAVLFAASITAGSVAFRSDLQPEGKIAAKTLAQIEEEKKEKQAEIDAKKEEIEELSKNISQKDQYQKSLIQQIDLVNDKMTLIDTQIQNVNIEIYERQDELAALDQQIADQQQSVDEGIALFKQRIRTLYIYGNDSMLSALVGASDFYEVLSKYEMIKRISKHDDDLIDNLRKNIDTLTKLQQDKTSNLQALNIKEKELQSLRSEFSDSRTEMSKLEASAGLEKLDLMQERVTVNEGLSLNEAELDALREEGEAIILEAAKKAAEEAARKKAEEEAARKAAEEAKKKTTTTTTATTTKRTTTTTTTKKIVTTAPPATTKKTTTTTATTKKTAATSATTKQTVKTTATTSKATTVTTVSTTAKSTTTKVTTTVSKKPSSGKIEYRGGSLAWPVPGYYHISSPFGPRWGKIHKGMDICGSGKPINGANVYPCAVGTVITAKYGWNWGFGNYIQIDHGNGLVTLYAHLSSISCSEGQRVQLGQKIGNVGSTGNSTGPHLHLGVILNGNYVNPQPYLY